MTTDFNQIISVCLANDIEFEINKRFADNPNIEFIFNINVRFDDTLKDDKRVTYTVLDTVDDTSKILNIINTYLNLNPTAQTTI